jgi:hypothetical protein
LWYGTDKDRLPIREARGAIAERYPFLFANAENDPAVNAAHEALTSTNLTVRGKWIEAVGDRAKCDRQAREYGLRDSIDMRAGRAPEVETVNGNSSKPKPSPAENPFAYGGANTDRSGRFTAAALAKQHAMVLRDPKAAADAARRAGVTRIGATHAPRPAA